MKFRHQITLVLTALALAMACDRMSAPAPLEDTPENRTAQIDRYFEAMPPENLAKDMVTRMAAHIPDDQRTRFVDAMTKQLDVPKLRSIMRDGMAKHFTADEMRALADFYGSELGKSAMAKFGTYMGEVMPAIQAEIMVAVGKVREELAPAAPAPAPGAPAEPDKSPAPPAEPPKE
jgi:hypothetical protein